MVDNGYSMRIHYTPLSLRMKEEKECLIYIFSQATFHLNKLICGRPVLKTINDGYIQ